LGTARWVIGNKIRVSVSNASDAAVVAKFTAPFKMELIDWAIITKVAGSGPTVSLTRANDVITWVIPVSTASHDPRRFNVVLAYWKTSNTVVESGSIVRLAITQSHVYDFVNVLSYRPMS
jgi:transcriptional regulator of nitric oxide reductase